MKVDLITRKLIRDKISAIIRGRVVSLAISFIATKVAWLATGPWGWVLNIVLSAVWNLVGDKMVRWAVRKGGLVLDKTQGKIRINKINKAKQDEDIDEYVDTISNI